MPNKMNKNKRNNKINDKNTEHRQPGEYGVPEAPPEPQSKDPRAGLHVDRKDTSYTSTGP